MTGLLSAANEAEALELLHDSGCTDGLPVVIPAPDRVARLVLASGLDADIDLGAMGPGGGSTTIEKVATNAVMAGCVPDHMPVVVAAMRAMLRTEFDLGEMQSTTHCTAPLMIVNGPVVEHCGIAGGFGALGPGHRANASIGRAVRLCMMNIGDARPGVSDMALLGQPGKFSFCLAEAERSSPWGPLSDAGMSRRYVQAELHRLAVNTRGHIRSLNTGFVPAGAADDLIPAVRRPDDIVVFISGGSGLYSAVFPSWAAGAHRNTIVHERVATGAACDLPWATG